MGRPLVALILAGGTGTYLYPTNQSGRPKRFLPLGDDRSLLAETAARADFAGHVAVSTHPMFTDDIANHAPDAEVVVEPAARDTGPALVYVAYHVTASYDDPIMVVLPSDRHVGDGSIEAMTSGARVAADTNSLVAFGVKPTHPETDYGYIEPGTNRDDARDLTAFHEKPNAETAARYVDQGCLWDTGMFTRTPEALFSTAHDSPFSPFLGALDDGDADASFTAVKGVNIGYTVIERAADTAVVPADFEWDDLGSWDTLEQVVSADGDGNVTLGDDPASADAAGNVVATDDVTVSFVGVSNPAIVVWGDRIPVVPKEEARKVHKVVSRLKREEIF